VQRALWEEAQVLAEPGGATALAALLCGAGAAAPGEQSCVVVCAADLDPASCSVHPEAGSDDAVGPAAQAPQLDADVREVDAGDGAIIPAGRASGPEIAAAQWVFGLASPHRPEERP
jgi:hypothetical protein